MWSNASENTPLPLDARLLRAIAAQEQQRQAEIQVQARVQAQVQARVQAQARAQARAQAMSSKCQG